MRVLARPELSVKEWAMYRITRVILLSLGVSVFGLVVFFFVAFRYLHFSTNSAVLYLLKDAQGFHLRTDIAFEEIDSLVFKVDATQFFNRVFETVSDATHRSFIDLSYDPVRGKGEIKDFRPGGRILEIALSRHTESVGEPRGVAIGGDFPPGDSGMRREGGGIALFDGSRWVHLWCTANEGIAASGGGEIFEPFRWDFLSSRIIKQDAQEVILESTHSVMLDGGVPVLITRRLQFRSGENHVHLITKVTNTGRRSVLFDYSYGDEPWLGVFGTSEGDVGWYEEGLASRERFVNAQRYAFAGFADVGNPEAGERRGGYTGYANYIKWHGIAPSLVFFANDLKSVNDDVLDSKDGRLLDIVWKNQYLLPGESRTLQLQIGFVEPGKDLASVARELSERQAAP